MIEAPVTLPLDMRSGLMAYAPPIAWIPCLAARFATTCPATGDRLLRVVAANGEALYRLESHDDRRHLWLATRISASLSSPEEAR